MDSDAIAVRGLRSLSSEDAIQAINALPFAYYRASLDGKVLAASKAMVNIFGYDSIDDIIGVEISKHYVDSNGRARFLEALEKGQGVVDNFEAEMRGPRGIFWVATSARLITDDKGNPIALEGLTRDISQQRAVFDELGRGAALFEAFAVGADIGVAVSTTSGDEIFLNDRMRELLDLEPAQAESSSILERMSPELQAVSLDARRAVMAGSAAYHKEVLIPVAGKNVMAPLLPVSNDDSAF